MTVPTSRWAAYDGSEPAAAPGWHLETLVGPAPTWGANGILWGPSQELIVTQVFGAHVTAIDVETGLQRAFAPQGADISAPDDGAFTADGTFFATEPPNGRVTVRRPDGSTGVLRDDLPGANGMTVSHDGRRLFVDEFRPGGRLLELDPAGERDPVVLADDLAMPNAFAMGPDGALWFPQVLAGEIWRYDLDRGSLERRFTDLATPTAVKFDSRNRLVTSEAGSGRVTAIDLADGGRTTLAQVDTGIDNFALGPDDRLFVSHFTNGRVAEVTGGVERLLADSGLIGPYGLARLDDGRWASADGLAVNIVGPDGVPIVAASLLADLPGMVIDVAAAGTELFLLVQRGQVLRREADGRLISVAGFLDRVSAITAAPGGGAYVVEGGPGRVLHIDGTDSGAEPRVVLDGLTRPRGIAVAGDGSLWVAQQGGVVAFVDGRPTTTIDVVAEPHDVAVTDTAVAITDPAGRRVVVVERPGGSSVVAATDLPLGPPVAGARMPLAHTPLEVDGDGFVVGCDGDGSIRRLARR